MAAPRPALIALVLSASLPLGAAGQTTVSEPAPVEVPETSPTKSWQVGVDALGIVESNVGFQSPAGSADDSLSLDARLTRLLRSPRGQLRLALDGDAVVYRTLTEFDHVDAALRLDGSHRSSPQLTLKYRADAAYQTTDRLALLIDQGLQFARARAFSVGASAGVDDRISLRTVLRMEGQYQRIDFDVPSLVDTDSAEARVSLVRRLGPRDGLSPAYSYRYVGGGTGSDAIHEWTLRWSRLPTRGFGFDVGGGEAFAPARALRPQGKWFLVGTAGVERHVRRALLTANISREGTPAYGLGELQLSDILTVAASVPFRRRLTIVGAAVIARNRDLGSGRRRETSHYANVSLAYRLLRHTSLALGYRYRYLHDDTVEGIPVDSHRASFGLSYEAP